MASERIRKSSLRGGGGGTTLVDVARRAGVACSTASYVLNNKPKSFGAETRERILTAARELGYRPNMAARSLVTNRTNLIALWVPDVTSAFSARVISQMQKLAWQDGYEVMISEIHIPDREPTAGRDAENASGHFEPPAAQVKLPLWNCDGIIAFLGSACRNVHLDTLAARQIPMVSMGAYPVENTDFVGVELLSGTREALARLTASPTRQRIGYLVPVGAAFEGDDRREGYLSAIHASGREPILISMQGNTRAAARAAMAAFLAAEAPLDGLFCYNDDAAIGAYRALRDAGRRIPEDVALVGCDGIDDVLYLDRTLSTLVLPVEEMCATAWNFLARRLSDPDHAPQTTAFSGRLELREST